MDEDAPFPEMPEAEPEVTPETTPEPPTPTDTISTYPQGRLMAIDALRGFDMFWILGADELVHGLSKLNQSAPVTFLSKQLSHVHWEGFHSYDLIFPLFVFLAGVSIPFSLDKMVARDGKKKAYARVCRRFLLLYLAGILYYGGLSHFLPEIRFVGVLQRIALSYFGAALLYLALRPRWLGPVCVAILLAYWALFAFVPVPSEPALTAVNPEWGLGGISTAEGNNWGNYIDYHFLPGRNWDTYWDPEGLLSSIPAVASALLGIFAGLLLRSARPGKAWKGVILIAAGIALAAAGYAWGTQAPQPWHFAIIKKLWTSSYVLLAGGYSSILLGVFYLVVDVWGVRRWTTPFLWIGANALTLYLASAFIDFNELARLFVGGYIEELAGPAGQLLVGLTSLLLILLLGRFLYRRKIFLRL